MMGFALTAIWQGGYDVYFGHGSCGAEPLVGRRAALSTQAYHPPARGDKGFTTNRQGSSSLPPPTRLVHGLVRDWDRPVLRRGLPSGLPLADALEPPSPRPHPLDALR